MAGSDDIFELEDDLNDSRSVSNDSIDAPASRTGRAGHGTQTHKGKQNHRLPSSFQQAAPAIMGVSVPISIPTKLKRASSPNRSPSANEFVPPHQLSQQSQSHLAQSVPLTSSAQLRTRDLLMTATGMLPRHGPEGPLLHQPPGRKSFCTTDDGSVSASLQGVDIQRRWDRFAPPSPSGAAQCTGGLSCPSREMQPFLRRTAPLERHPRYFAMVPEGH